MKRILLSISLVAALTLVSCKEKASEKINASNVEVAAERDAVSKNLPVMSFDKAEHDFGVIEQGAPQETVFTFTNTGNAPLIITNATSSCGCTVPEYPKNTPIEPGQSGEMLVRFNGSGQNQVTKTITVSANTAKGSEMLRIKAFVTPKSSTSASTLGPVK
ncbi:DUF1573 domain-containing protein [Lentiprolixibacter aurantiacus]|uniref:DUF1573 domain-containing protein n=1 Tax=Lentiprolixibacter aurantiacus TaxID=2993939 RepID=A0AAE3MPA0_9FLAO|nr:DUF1573 domain-containing protein [Lentiprolixibacter aurantiacus]MCX2720504.1 DUF1573 domain-containing protein [Lentiprolixibacter aurantiacus]